ncbi:hypothetical protein NCC49_004527 [Naganishia albida]|nr:hypothetical protein NCC49_004527 [Naganishia albida]
MTPPSGQAAPASRPPPGGVAQRPGQGVSPITIPAPHAYNAASTFSTFTSQPFRPPVTAPPQANTRPTSPYIPNSRPPAAQHPAKPASTAVQSTTLPPAANRAVRTPAQQPSITSTEDETDEQVFKAYVDALSATNPQVRAAISVHPPSSNPPNPPISMQQQPSPRPANVKTPGSGSGGFGTVKTTLGARPVKADGVDKVSSDVGSGVQNVSMVRNRAPESSSGVVPVVARASIHSGTAQVSKPANIATKPASVPIPTSTTQSTTQAFNSSHPQSRPSSVSAPSTTPQMSSATAAAAAAAAAWNARFGPTIDERLFTPTPSRSPVASSSALVSSSAPTPPRNPAPPSEPVASSTPASSTAPAAVSAPKTTKTGPVARRKIVESDTTSSDESRDEDGVIALPGGGVPEGEAGKNDAEKERDSDVAPSGANATRQDGLAVNGDKGASAPASVAQSSTEPKKTSSETIAQTSTPSASAPPNAPPSQPTADAPAPSAQPAATVASVPVSAPSHGKKGPWKYHALVEEQLVDGVWRRVGEVEGTHIEVSSAPRSTSLAPSASKDQEDGLERTSQHSTRGGRGRGRPRGSRSRVMGNSHRLSSQSIEIAKDSDQAERELVAVWGPDFRQIIEVESKNHQYLLRLAGYGITYGWTLEQIRQELFRVRDARLAERKRDPGSNARVTGVNYADIMLVLKNCARGVLGNTHRDESGANGVAERELREPSATPKLTNSGRRVGTQKPRDNDAERSESESRSLRPVNRRRYAESDIEFDSDDDKPIYRRHKRARHNTHEPSPPRQSERRQPQRRHPERSPMDQLMITSFLNFSQSAPDALGAGQEMNLRFGRDSTGAYYFTHTVTTEQPPISVDLDGRPTSIRSGYRLSPLTLGRLDDMLEISLAVPPSSATPVTASVASPLANGTNPAVPSPAEPPNTQSPPSPQKLSVPDVVPGRTVRTARTATSATSLPVTASETSPDVANGQTEPAERSASIVPPANSSDTDSQVTASSAQTGKPLSPHVAATANGSGPMDVDPSSRSKATNGVTPANTVSSMSTAVNPPSKSVQSSKPLVVYPEASASFIVPKLTGPVPILPSPRYPPQP